MPTSTPDEGTASTATTRFTIRSISARSFSSAALSTQVQKRNQSYDASQRTKFLRLRAITKNFTETS